MTGKQKGRHPETENIIANKSYKELKVWGEQKQHMRGRVEGMEGEDTHRSTSVIQLKLQPPKHCIIK